jgi:hypothetical protein
MTERKKGGKFSVARIPVGLVRNAPCWALGPQEAQKEASWLWQRKPNQAHGLARGTVSESSSGFRIKLDD